MDPATELKETKRAIMATRLFVANYVATARRTGDEPVAKCAAKRIEEGLIDAMRTAVEQLAPGNQGDHIREMEAFIASLEGPLDAPDERVQRHVAEAYR